MPDPRYESQKPELHLPEDPRQQDKLINFIITGELTDKPLYSADRQSFLKDLADGTREAVDMKTYISRLRRPTEQKYIDSIFDESTPDELAHYKGIALLALEKAGRPKAIGKEFHVRRGEIEGVDFEELRSKYPHPWDLKNAMEAPLDVLEEKNGKTKRNEYEEDLQKLMHIMYGKRYEYYIQGTYLFKHAEKIKGGKKEKPKQESHNGEILMEKYKTDEKVNDANVSTLRRYLRSNGQLPITIKNQAGTYDVYTFDLGSLPNEVDGAGTAYEEAFSSIAKTIKEMYPGEENKKRRLRVFWNAVSPDHNDSTELIFEGRPNKENRIRSNLLVLYNEALEFQQQNEKVPA